MHVRWAGPGVALLLALTTAGCGDEAPRDPAPACPRLGVYSGWDQGEDLLSEQWFGALPEVANSYYDHTQRISLERETARIERGTSPNITITTKGSDFIEVIARGPADPRWAQVGPWLDRTIADLVVLADADPEVPVYVTLDHEFVPKVRTGEISGPSADPVVFGRALDRFYAMVDEAGPQLRTTYWIAGSDRTVEGLVGDQFDTLPEVVLFDPYPREPDETLTSIAAEDVAWIRDQAWYAGQEIGLGEFAMHAPHGDAAMARFYTGIRRQLKDLGIAWAVLFNSDRFDTRIAGRADGRAFPQAQAAFGRSLREADVC